MVYHPPDHHGGSNYHGSSYDSNSVEGKAAYFADKDDPDKHGKDHQSDQIYNKKDDAAGYNKNEEYQKAEKEEDKKKEENDKPSITDKLEQEEKAKKEADEKIDDTVIFKKAAEEIHQGIGQLHFERAEEKKKKAKSSIEDAIKKAIKEEKEVIRLDD